MTPLRWLIDLIRGAHPAELVMLALAAAFGVWLAKDASAAPSCPAEYVPTSQPLEIRA